LPEPGQISLREPPLGEGGKEREVARVVKVRVRQFQEVWKSTLVAEGFDEDGQLVQFIVDAYTLGRLCEGEGRAIWVHPWQLVSTF
jgi:hypothetical protein